ncbi:hypothetical protein UKMH10_4680 [Burkholderia pseudomallei]|nr:hypothetical protein UKMH10_4680 [Burkholderia pseudomallei]
MLRARIEPQWRAFILRRRTIRADSAFAIGVIVS